MVLRAVYFHNWQVIGTVLCGNCVTEVEKQCTGRPSFTVSIDGEYFQDMRHLFKDLHKKRKKKKKKTQTSSNIEVFLSLHFHSLHLQRWKFSSLPATAALLFLKATLYGSLPWWSWRVGSAPWANRRDRTPMWPSWRTFASIFVYPISTCADTARGEAPWQHCWFTSAPAVSKMSAMCRWPWLSKDQYFVDDDDADDDEVALVVKRSVWWWWWWCGWWWGGPGCQKISMMLMVMMRMMMRTIREET